MKVICTCGALVDIPLSEADKAATCARCHAEVRVQKTRTGALASSAADPSESAFFRIAPATLLAYVVLLLFLPIFQVECMGMKLKWTGVQLISGDAPSMPAEIEATGAVMTEGSRRDEYRAQWHNRDAPRDMGVLGFPLAAVASILAIMLRRRGLATALLAVLLGTFLWHWLAGFKIERAIRSEITLRIDEQKRQPDAQTASLRGVDEVAAQMIENSMQRTVWFWTGFVAALSALLLVHFPSMVRLALRGPPA